MKILIADSALNDLKAIKEYYAEEGVPQTGDEFIIHIITHIETLIDNRKLVESCPSLMKKIFVN